CEILTGAFFGRIALIPRIKLEPTGDFLPFNFSRLQFPVRLSFAMTINKSQGQTFDKVGILLEKSVFTYGERLPVSPNFTYLGCDFKSNGIDWNSHFSRLDRRATVSLMDLCRIGCNSKGTRIQAISHLYKSMVQSSLEYCMAL